MKHLLLDIFYSIGWLFALWTGLHGACVCHAMDEKAASTSFTCSADDETCILEGNKAALDDQLERIDSDASACQDLHESCSFWAEEHDQCDRNPAYMHTHCAKSCGRCSDSKNIDDFSYAQLDLALDMGVAQTLIGLDVTEDMARRRIEESREYYANVDVKPELKELCRNEHALCTLWALIGECTENPMYMKKSCAPACQSCEYLSIEGRCPIDPNATNAWNAGDLNAMFTRLSSEPFLTDYEVEVHSSPSTTGGPWVITMENVVSEEEAVKLIELGALEGYERSSDVGKLKADGSFESNVNSGRTSTNAWCQNDCYKDETAQTVVHRLSNITGIDEANSEFLQLLRYEEGQYYQIHHDNIEHHLKRQPGVRILTLYLYLNDVEEEGGTNFDRLGITVEPKRGRALLWPSVLDENPDTKDGRTTHQALAVKKGVKYGANAWFHQRDFKAPNANGCH